MTKILSILLLGLSLLTVGDDLKSLELGTPVPTSATAFAVGEVLEYKLVWGGITAGNVTIKTVPKSTINDQAAWKFVLIAKTRGLADKIYKVRLNIASLLSEDLSCSLEYFADKVEGSRTKVQRFTYDWDTMLVHYQKNKTEDRGKRPLRAKSYDPLGMFFAIRNMTIDDKTNDVKIWVSDGKENTFSKATIIKKETITVNNKSYETYLVEPELTNLKGVFSKSDDAKLQLWLTTDKHHIPVRIKSKVAVGSFTAELTKFTKGK